MSMYDNYGGTSYDSAFDEGCISDWNPLDHIGDEDDVVWSETYADPTGWNESTVTALVFSVDVPEHDSEGNVEDQPLLIPEQYIGQKAVFVVKCIYDWGHTCDGFAKVCPVGTTLEQAQMGAKNLCEGPLSNAETLLVADKEWLPGNPEFIFDDSDEENKVVYLRYWRPFALEPYDSGAIPFDEDPAAAIWEYAFQMGWNETPPNLGNVEPQE